MSVSTSETAPPESPNAIRLDIAVVTEPERKTFRPRRVCFPLEGFNMSGGVRVLCQIANGLAERGHSVRMIVPDYQSEPPFALHPKVEVQALQTSGRGALRKLDYLRQLCNVAALGNDVTFATNFKTPLYVYFSHKFHLASGTLIYLLQHSYRDCVMTEYEERLRFLRPLFLGITRLGYALPFRRVAVSRWILERVGRADCEVISNGIDPNLFAPEDEKTAEKAAQAEFTLGVIEAASPWKGYGLFLEAMQLLPAEEKERMRVLIACREEVELPDGVSAERIRTKRERDMADFYRQCDAFVFTSRMEGFGLPPLEAMACGIPTITTDCGGVREFADESNTLLVPVGDAEALAAAILRLKADPELRTRLRERGLATARERTLTKMIERYCRLVESLSS